MNMFIRGLQCGWIGGQFRQGHGAMLSSQYRCTASSAQKSTDTSTAFECQVNGSRKSASSAFSFSRANPIVNAPERVVHREASTERTAVHRRSKVGGCMGENRADVNARMGLQTGGLAA
jgi:hypothetical protein